MICWLTVLFLINFSFDLWPYSVRVFFDSVTKLVTVAIIFAVPLLSNYIEPAWLFLLTGTWADLYSEDAHYDEIIGYTQKLLAIFLNVGECWNITMKQSTTAFFQMLLLADRDYFLSLSLYV
jgi:hypothetical protein